MYPEGPGDRPPARGRVEQGLGCGGPGTDEDIGPNVEPRPPRHHTGEALGLVESALPHAGRMEGNGRQDGCGVGEHALPQTSGHQNPKRFCRRAMPFILHSVDEDASCCLVGQGGDQTRLVRAPQTAAPQLGEFAAAIATRLVGPLQPARADRARRRQDEAHQPPSDRRQEGPHAGPACLGRAGGESFCEKRGGDGTAEPDAEGEGRLVNEHPDAVMGRETSVAGLVAQRGSTLAVIEVDHDS